MALIHTPGLRARLVRDWQALPEPRPAFDVWQDEQNNKPEDFEPYIPVRLRFVEGTDDVN